MESEELHSLNERVPTRRRRRWMEPRGAQQQLDYNAPLLSVRRLAEVSNGGGGAPAEVGGSKSLWKLSSELSAEPVRLPGSVPFGWEDRPGKPKQQQDQQQQLQQQHRHFSSSSSSSPAHCSSSNSTSCASPAAGPASPSPPSTPPVDYPPILHRFHKPPPPPPPPPPPLPPPRPFTKLCLRPSQPPPMPTISVPSSPSSSPSSISHSSLLLSLSPPPSHNPKSSSSPSSLSEPQDLQLSPGHKLECSLAHESNAEPPSARQSLDKPSYAKDKPPHAQAEKEGQEKENVDNAGALVALEQADSGMRPAKDVKAQSNLAIISPLRSSASTSADGVAKSGMGCSRKLSKGVSFSSCSRVPSFGFIRKAVAQLYRRAAASARSISMSKCKYIEATPGAVRPAYKAARSKKSKGAFDGTLAIRSLESISQAIQLPAGPASSSLRPIQRQQLSATQELPIVDAGKAAQSFSGGPSSDLVVFDGIDHGSSHDLKHQGESCFSRSSLEKASSQSSPNVRIEAQPNLQTSPQIKLQPSSRSSPNARYKSQHMAAPIHLLQGAGAFDDHHYRGFDDHPNRRSSVHEEMFDFYDAPSRFGSRNSSPGRFNGMIRRAGSSARKDWSASPSAGDEAFADATSSPLQTPRDSLSENSATQSWNYVLKGGNNLARKSERPSSGSSLSKRTGKDLRLDTVSSARSSVLVRQHEPQAARHANTNNAIAIASGDHNRKSGDQTSRRVACIELQDCPGYRRRCKFLSGEHELRRPLRGHETYSMSPEHFSGKAAIARLNYELQEQEQTQSSSHRSNIGQFMSKQQHRQLLVRQSSLKDRAAYDDDHHRQSSVPPIFPPKFQRRLLIGRPGTHIAQVAVAAAEEDVGWPFGIAGYYHSIRCQDKSTSSKGANGLQAVARVAVPSPPLPPSPAVSWLKKALLAPNVSCKTAPLLDVLHQTGDTVKEQYTVAVLPLSSAKEKLQLRINKTSAPGQIKRWEELVKKGR